METFRVEVPSATSSVTGRTFQSFALPIVCRRSGGGSEEGIRDQRGGVLQFLHPPMHTPSPAATTAQSSLRNSAAGSPMPSHSSMEFSHAHAMRTEPPSPFINFDEEDTMPVGGGGKDEDSHHDTIMNSDDFPASHHRDLDDDSSSSDGRPTGQQKKRRRLGISVFVDPMDHPDNHVLRHLNLCAASVPVRDKSRRLTQLLASHPLFRSLSPEITRRVFTEFIREVKDGSSVLFSAGDLNDVFYLVDEGEVHCFYEDDGVCTVIRKGVGDTVGDLALMQPCMTPQTFTARITSPTATLFSIDGCIFRFLLQNGMQLRYAQLKTFFQGLSLFNHLPYSQACQGELIENLIENAQILEFHEGDTIVPMSPAEPVSPILSLPRLSLRDTDMLSPQPSPQPSPSPTNRSIASTVVESSSESVATSSPPSSSSSTSALPSYLASSVFLVKDGVVSVKRPIASKPSLDRALTDPTHRHHMLSCTTTQQPSDCCMEEREVKDGELFGLEVLSCHHRLLDLSQSSSVGSPLLSPTPHMELPGTMDSGATTTSPSSRSRSVLAQRKRGRSDSDLDDDEDLAEVNEDEHEDEHDDDSPCASPMNRMLFPPHHHATSSVPHPHATPGSPNIHTTATLTARAIRECSCRGEIRCKSTAAIVIAIDAKCWRNILKAFI